MYFDKGHETMRNSHAIPERGRKTISYHTKRFHAETPYNNTVQRHRKKHNKFPSGSTREPRETKLIFR